MTTRRIGTREEWSAASTELLKREKEHTRAGDELARQRRELPWVPVEKEYTFQTEGGAATLRELFDDRSQLAIYHFMFGPDWEAGCESCSLAADEFARGIVHLNARDVTMVCVSRAPIEKLAAYRRRMGWDFTWASAHATTFNFDFGVSFTPEQQAGEAPAEYNFRAVEKPGDEAPGLSAFVLEDGVVYRTYSTFGRGLEPAIDIVYALLDRVSKGRDEGDGDDWIRRRDEYAA
jgi:predicted dithiol-disulfide oxidoreductase (DUF899 family)